MLAIKNNNTRLVSHIRNAMLESVKSVALEQHALNDTYDGLCFPPQILIIILNKNTSAIVEDKMINEKFYFNLFYFKCVWFVFKDWTFIINVLDIQLKA